MRKRKSGSDQAIRIDDLPATTLPLVRQHRMGIHYGYDIEPDGTIHLAPGLHEQVDKLIDEEEGLRQLVETVSTFAAQQFGKLKVQKKAWWDRVFDDLRIERGSGLNFSYQDGKITPAKQEKKSDAA